MNFRSFQTVPLGTYTAHYLSNIKEISDHSAGYKVSRQFDICPSKWKFLLNWNIIFHLEKLQWHMNCPFLTPKTKLPVVLTVDPKCTAVLHTPTQLCIPPPSKLENWTIYFAQSNTKGLATAPPQLVGSVPLHRRGPAFAKFEEDPSPLMNGQPFLYRQNPLQHKFHNLHCLQSAGIMPQQITSLGSCCTTTPLNT